MKKEWAHVKNVFSPEECAYILKEGMKIDMQTEPQFGHSIHRKSNIRFIRAETNTSLQFIWHKLWEHANNVNDELFGFDITELNAIQLAEYSGEYHGEYRQHQDVWWVNGTDKHRKLSCVIQLSDPSTYEGGKFEVYGLQKQPNDPSDLDFTALGSITFIPSFLQHAALPVYAGVRYSLAAWFEGPCWR